MKCSSSRSLYVNAKCDSNCYTELDGNDNTGYVPTNLNIGVNGVCVSFTVCADCGHMLGKWPLGTEDVLEDTKLDALADLNIDSSDDESTITSKLNAAMNLILDGDEEEEENFIDIDYQPFPEGHSFITGSDCDD